MTEQVRGYIYRILVAVGALVAGYGYMREDEVALWLGVAAVVFNSMPSFNTKVKKDPTDE
jgi:hypothetical protein